ncbi:LysM peptidoglycan-binding domain-containing protein [Aerosakkonema sp. BLCC-F183]|uniref:CIS tube protein n=1 Tax=Aerosakkonema sp. BLCC-F183 TaxID=3342834 RepID=UPI0035BB7E0B
MALEKLKILIEDQTQGIPNKEIRVLFNPNQVAISKTGWREDPGQGLVADREPATLSIELFFDTTILGKYPPENVQNYTKQIYSLTLIGKNERPPLCQLIWGKNILLPLGILKSLTKTLTHFLEDGTPVAAKLSCNFQEWQDPTQKKKIENPIDDPIRIVKQGETLSSIAAEEYNDPTLWRLIAKKNQIDNPRLLKPGQRLTIPPRRANSIT